MPADVEEAVVRIEADGAEGGEAVLQQHGVGERQQGVDRVARRAAVAGLEVEGAAGRGRLEHAGELAEVEGGGLALGAEQDGGVGDAVEAVEQVGHVAGGGLVAAAQ